MSQPEPSPPAELDRASIVDMLATFGARTPELVPESIGSMELAWLVHQVEQRHGVTLDLTDADLSRMDTVTAAVEVLPGLLDRDRARHG